MSYKFRRISTPRSIQSQINGVPDLKSRISDAIPQSENHFEVVESHEGQTRPEPRGPASYSLENGFLVVEKPNNRIEKYELSQRALQLALFDSLTQIDSDGEYPLYFPVAISPDLEPFLISYLSDQTDPLERLPVLTVQEIYEIAAIDTYLGGNNTGFWQKYGFEDANKAIIELNAALYVVQAADTRELKKATSDSKKLARAFTFKETPVAELIAQRGQIDKRVVPFFYAAIRETLPSWRETRDAIAVDVLNPSLREAHLNWACATLMENSEERQRSISEKVEGACEIRPCYAAFYFGMQNYQTLDFIVDERKTILGSVSASIEKKEALISLYRNASKILTSDFLQSEHREISGSTLWPYHRKVVISALLTAGSGVTSAEEFRERIKAALISNSFSEIKKILFVQKLHLAKIKGISLDAFYQEKREIYSWDFSLSDKGIALRGLYLNIKNVITPKFIEMERNAILIEFKTEAESKSDLIADLYSVAAPRLTREVVVQEYALIQTIADDWDKHKCLLALFKFGAPAVSHDMIVSVRDQIISSNFSNNQKGEFLDKLYQNRVLKMSAQEFQNETSMVLAFLARVNDPFVKKAIQNIYIERGPKFTESMMVTQRNAISALRFGPELASSNSTKTDLLESVYTAASRIISTEILQQEITVIIQNFSQEKTLWDHPMAASLIAGLVRIKESSFTEDLMRRCAHYLLTTYDTPEALEPNNFFSILVYLRRNGKGLHNDYLKFFREEIFRYVGPIPDNHRLFKYLNSWYKSCRFALDKSIESREILASDAFSWAKVTALMALHTNGNDPFIAVKTAILESSQDDFSKSEMMHHLHRAVGIEASDSTSLPAKRQKL